MVKVYNNVGRTYVRGYGHCPVVYHRGGSMGEIAYQSGKTLPKTAAHKVKNKNYTPFALFTLSIGFTYNFCLSCCLAVIKPNKYLNL